MKLIRRTCVEQVLLRMNVLHSKTEGCNHVKGTSNIGELGVSIQIKWQNCKIESYTGNEPNTNLWLCIFGDTVNDPIVKRAIMKEPVSALVNQVHKQMYALSHSYTDINHL